MSAKLGIAISLFCIGAVSLAMAQVPKHAELRVKVVQQQSTTVARPFSNVSGFLLRRINQPYLGASCQEPTNVQGMLSCRFVCLKQTESATINLVPPRTLDGYADSGEVQIELRGCNLSRQEIVVVYRDAAVALRETLGGGTLGSQFASVGSPIWDPVGFNTVKTDFAALASTPAGRKKLDEVRFLSDVLARSKQYESNPAASAALRTLSVGSANILLQDAAGQLVDAEMRKRITVSASKNDFYKNLDVLENKIQTKPAKTSQDFDALRGIRDLKEEPGHFKAMTSPSPFLVRD